eukprot:10290490-Prorocentrum_lima.AAC.1
MTSSLVGSEMCIRDREEGKKDQRASNPVTVWYNHMKQQYGASVAKWPEVCLLYTSDAADDM